jgi:hypothetical protein
MSYFLVIAAIIAGFLTFKLGMWGYIPGVVLIWVAIVMQTYPAHKNPEAVGVVPMFFGWLPGVFWCLIFYVARLTLAKRNRK